MPLALDGSPNLKPYRNYNENEIINGEFSSSVVPMKRGTVVTITVASGSPNVNVTGTGTAPVPFLSNAPYPYGGVPNFVTTDFLGIWGNQVSPCNSGNVPLGITVVDVAETNKYGESYASRPRYERYENEIVASGEAVKILTRGILKIKGAVGTPSANTGAYPSGGLLVVCPYNKAAYPSLLGKFLGPNDADGYAKFKLEL